MSPTSPLLGGIELGGTKCVCVIGTGPDDIRMQICIPTGNDPPATLSRIEKIMRERHSAARRHRGARNRLLWTARSGSPLAPLRLHHLDRKAGLARHVGGRAPRASLRCAGRIRYRRQRCRACRGALGRRPGSQGFCLRHGRHRRRRRPGRERVAWRMVSGIRSSVIFALRAKRATLGQGPARFTATASRGSPRARRSRHAPGCRPTLLPTDSPIWELAAHALAQLLQALGARDRAAAHFAGRRRRRGPAGAARARARAARRELERLSEPR